VTAAAARVLATALLEGDDLPRAAVLDDLAGDADTRQERGAGAGGRHRTRETTMFAVIKTGGKQYRVAANDVITLRRREGLGRLLVQVIRADQARP
jgi:hypothetical protein